MALVDAVESQEVSWGSRGCGGAFEAPSHCWGVVAHGCHSAASDVGCLGQDVMMDNESRQLQVGISDGPVGVAKGDQVGLHPGGKGGPPNGGRDVGVGCGRKPRPSHSPTGGIMGSQGHGQVRNNLGQLGGPVRKGGGQEFKICELVPHFWGDPDAVAVGVAQALLEETEEAPAAGDAQGHAAEFAQDFVPLFDGNPVFAPKAVEDLLESVPAMRRKFQGLADRVHQPTQDDFARGKEGVALQEFLHGRHMFASWRVLVVQGTEHCIDGMEEASDVMQAGSRGPLGQLNEVVHVAVCVADRFEEGAQGGPRSC